MSATERLRALLDERGVRHYDGTETTLWLKDGNGYRASADEGLNGFIKLHLWCTTPEQAVEATLGRDDVFTREEVESAFVSGYSLGTLPVGSDPVWDENEQTVDEHMAELGWVRKEAATPGCGECEMEYVSDFMSWHCKACGQMDMAPRDPKPRYCKWCGRKVVDL